MPPKKKQTAISDRSFDQLKNEIPTTPTTMSRFLKRLGQLSSGVMPPPEKELRAYFMRLSEAKSKDGKSLWVSGNLKESTVGDIKRIAEGMGIRPPTRFKGKKVLLEKMVQGVEDAMGPQADEEGFFDDPPETVKDLKDFQRSASRETRREAKEFYDTMRSNMLLLEKAIPDFDNTIGDPYVALLVMRTAMGDPRSVSSIIKTFTEKAAVPAVIGNYNWCGPKTDIFKNVIEGRGWTNPLDRACMMHDLKYLMAGSSQAPEGQLSADVKSSYWLGMLGKLQHSLGVDNFLELLRSLLRRNNHLCPYRCLKTLTLNS
jgi:hypothetical protein